MVDKQRFLTTRPRRPGYKFLPNLDRQARNKTSSRAANKLSGHEHPSSRPNRKKPSECVFFCFFPPVFISFLGCFSFRTTPARSLGVDTEEAKGGDEHLCFFLLFFLSFSNSHPGVWEAGTHNEHEEKGIQGKLGKLSPRQTHTTTRLEPGGWCRRRKDKGGQYQHPSFSPSLHLSFPRDFSFVLNNKHTFVSRG